MIELVILATLIGLVWLVCRDIATFARWLERWIPIAARWAWPHIDRVGRRVVAAYHRAEPRIKAALERVKP